MRCSMKLVFAVTIFVVLLYLLHYQDMLRVKFTKVRQFLVWFTVGTPIHDIHDVMFCTETPRFSPVVANLNNFFLV